MPRTLLVVAAVALAAVSCGGSSDDGGAARPTGDPSPTAIRTVVRSAHRLPAGKSATVHAQAGIAITLTASTPKVSRGALSSSHGYPPARGYYVTFRITVDNTGKRPVDLGPTDFFVHVNGGTRVTSYDGNSPYSGAARQLDHTQLDPGEHVSAPLTFDVRRPHGRLAFAPDGSAAVTWTF